MMTHDLASFTQKSGFGARSARPKPRFLRCEFENFAQSCIKNSGAIYAVEH